MSLNKAIKTVRAHKGQRKQRMSRVQGLVGLQEANPSPRGSAELKREIENFIDKSNDIAAGLQYLILHETTNKGIEKYEKEMHTLGEEDADIVIHARRTKLRGPSPEVKLNIAPGGHQAEVTQRPLVNEELKPNPEEFRSRERCFKSFFASSMLQHGPIEEQQAYLHMCLVITLETSLSSKIEPDTPIFQDEANPEDNISKSSS